jgi:cell division septum initiation protein DivIVA
MSNNNKKLAANARAKAHYLANKEDKKAYAREYYRKNREKIRACPRNLQILTAGENLAKGRKTQEEWDIEKAQRNSKIPFPQFQET